MSYRTLLSAELCEATCIIVGKHSPVASCGTEVAGACRHLCPTDLLFLVPEESLKLNIASSCSIRIAASESLDPQVLAIRLLVHALQAPKCGIVGDMYSILCHSSTLLSRSISLHKFITSVPYVKRISCLLDVRSVLLDVCLVPAAE